MGLLGEDSRACHGPPNPPRGEEGGLVALGLASGLACGEARG